MNKKEFVELTGENPEDMFGEDWKYVLNDYNSDGTCKGCGGDGCQVCDGEGGI